MMGAENRHYDLNAVEWAAWGKEKQQSTDIKSLSSALKTLVNETNFKKIKKSFIKPIFMVSYV